MGKSNEQDYILWNMTPQEEKSLISLIDQYVNCKFWNEYPKSLTRKKFLKGYNLFGVKMWSGWVDEWYTEMIIRQFGQSLAFLVEKMKQRGLLSQEEAHTLHFWTTNTNHGQMFPLPKNVQARMILLQALFELSIEKDDIEWVIWQNTEWVLALKLKFYQLEDEESWGAQSLKKYKII